jgi:hypothetical protein
MAEPGSSRQRQADLALIRAARPAEAGALTALALAAKAHWGYPASFMARCRAALTIEPAMIRRHVFRLAEGEGGVILGFYGFEPDFFQQNLLRIVDDVDLRALGEGRLASKAR